MIVVVHRNDDAKKAADFGHLIPKVKSGMPE
jgi:hypothetical protein